MRRLRLLAPPAAAIALSGCLAAIPLVAAGGLIESHRGAADRSREASVAAAVPADPADPTSPVPRAGPAGFELLPTGTLPPPGAGDLAGAGERRLAHTAWDEFHGHASAAAARDPVDEGRGSALLAAPSALSPQTGDCSIRPPAVLLDLDPAGGLFDPSAAVTPDSALTQVLAALRAQTIDVFWISGNLADAAPAIRARLRESGLDPEDRDALLLLRYPDERKQERRAAIAGTHCLVAIAGDERADFDELFAYLKDRDSAVGLEPLIGEVWFLTPNPLS